MPDAARTVALIAHSGRPLERWQYGFEGRLVRLARELSAGRGTEVVVVPWHRVRFQDGTVVIRGPGLRAARGNTWPLAPSARRTPDALLSFPGGNPIDPSFPTPAEREALPHLADAGVDVEVREAVTLVRRILVAAARRGMPTNVPGPHGRIGRKEQLEWAVRAFELLAGRRIPRPATSVTRTGEVRWALEGLARRSVAGIVKPAHGARGEGIDIVPPGQSWVRTAQPRARWVVQELVADPLCVDGHKADLRAFIGVDTGALARSRQLSPILVRVAARPYERCEPEAEITNTAYRRRLGLPPSVHLLAMLGLPPPLQAALERGVGAAVEGVLATIRWWIEGAGLAAPQVPRRVLLWAVDLIAQVRGDEVEMLLLELNARPTLLRGQYVPDWAVARMLRREYLPMVLSAAS